MTRALSQLSQPSWPSGPHMPWTQPEDKEGRGWGARTGNPDPHKVPASRAALTPGVERSAPPAGSSGRPFLHQELPGSTRLQAGMRPRGADPRCRDPQSSPAPREWQAASARRRPPRGPGACVPPFTRRVWGPNTFCQVRCDRTKQPHQTCCFRAH